MTERRRHSRYCSCVLDSLLLAIRCPLLLVTILYYSCASCLSRRECSQAQASEKYRLEREKQDRDMAPPPLPKQRRRQLSVSEPARPVLAQEGSPLFRLPAELRLRIYREVLGGHVFHLLLLPRRVGHVQCHEHDRRRFCYSAASPAVPLQDPLRWCLRTHLLNGLHAEGDRAHEDRWMRADPAQLISRHKVYDVGDPLVDQPAFPAVFPLSTRAHLGLLKSCRRVYAEAIDTLYADNVFDVNHPQTFALFAATVLPQRLAKISALQVLWAHPDPPTQRPAHVDSPQAWWPRLWQDVCTPRRMPGLRHLAIRIVWPAFSDLSTKMWQEEQCLLGPVAVPRGLRSAELDVSRARGDWSLFDPGEQDYARGGGIQSSLGRKFREIVCSPLPPPPENP